VYPQGCDVCDHLSLFLCVADYDKLLPGARRLRQTRTLHCALRRCACAAGWSHFAQFTIAVVNRDPKKSKYSDTLHRFCKKEHDWGWKKFMDLSKVLEGFTVADTLLIKAQVQVIRERPFRPFRCLDAAYRRELVRVYLTNVEGLCRRFVDEKRDALAPLRAEAASYRAFWAGCPAKTRAALATERADVILKAVAKRFFNEKEVTSTLVMDALYCGCRALEDDGVAALEEGAPDGTGCPEAGACRVALSVAGNRVTLRGDLMTALERAAAGLDLRGAAWDDTAGGAGQQQLPPGAQQAAAGTALALVPSGGGEDAGRDACERDERRLATLGRRAVELFVAAHLYGSRFEVSYREALALQRQEALIREEAEQAERAAEDRCRQSDKKARAKQRRRERKEEEEAAAAEAAAVEARAAQAAADAAAEARAVAAAARAAAQAAKEAEEAKAAKAAAKAAAAARAAAAPPPPPLPAPPAPPPQAGSPSDEASSSGSESGSSSGGGGGGARQAAPPAAAATRGARQRSANGNGTANGTANSSGDGGDLAARVRALEARLAERDAEVAQLRAELAAAREAAAPAAPPRPTPPSPKKPVPARAPAAEPARGGTKTAATAQRATEPVQPLGVAAAAAAAAAQAAAAAAAAATTPAWVAAASSAPAANGHAAPPGAALPPRAPLPPAAAGSPPRPLANGAAAAAAAAPVAPAAARGAPPFPPPTVVPPAALAAAPQPPRTPAGKGAPAFGAPGGVPGDSPGLHDFPHLHMIEHLLDSSY